MHDAVARCTTRSREPERTRSGLHGARDATRGRSSKERAVREGRRLHAAPILELSVPNLQ